MNLLPERLYYYKNGNMKDFGLGEVHADGFFDWYDESGWTTIKLLNEYSGVEWRGPLPMPEELPRVESLL